jgi:diadenosine tetraphosphate (Ap4A) HIT family hydrolase
MPVFEIHPQLVTDCHRLGRFNVCHVLLNKNALLPWFILVPETDVTDLLDIPDEQRNAAINEAAVISQFVRRNLGYPKVNFAAIGNVVPQLHLHVVGRRPDDACWPAPVWGNLTEKATYSTSQLGRITELLKRSFGLKAAVDQLTKE